MNMPLCPSGHRLFAGDVSCRSCAQEDATDRGMSEHREPLKGPPGVTLPYHAREPLKGPPGVTLPYHAREPLKGPPGVTLPYHAAPTLIEDVHASPIYPRVTAPLPLDQLRSIPDEPRDLPSYVDTWPNDRATPDAVGKGQANAMLAVEVSRLSAVPVEESRRNVDPSTRTFGFVRTEIEFSDAGFPSTGTRLAERYAILARIAEGGMGVIFLVQERISGRAVALKVMRERAAQDEALVQQFIREAVITARLQHPSVVPVYELGFLTGDELYYTMRYVEGGSFASYLRDHTSLSDRLQVLRQAALGVNHAHSEGLWHRDVKPENILVGKHGEVHVIDWGLVSVQGGKPYKLKLPRLRLRDRVLDFEGIDLLLEETSEALSTQSGLLAGTPRYMAPEQLMRDDQLMGPRSDIWSFGVMLYEAIAERHPFGPSTENQMAFIAAVKNSPPPPLELLAPNTPPALISLCHRMLEKDPGRRLSTLAEFASELDAARGTSGQSLAVLPTTIATSNSPQIANLLVDNRQQREEIAVMRELLGTGLLRWRSRRALRRKLAELRSRSET